MTLVAHRKVERTSAVATKLEGHEWTARCQRVPSQHQQHNTNNRRISFVALAMRDRFDCNGDDDDDGGGGGERFTWTTAATVPDMMVGRTTTYKRCSSGSSASSTCICSRMGPFSVSERRLTLGRAPEADAPADDDVGATFLRDRAEPGFDDDDDESIRGWRRDEYDADEPCWPRYGWDRCSRAWFGVTLKRGPRRERVPWLPAVPELVLLPVLAGLPPPAASNGS